MGSISRDVPFSRELGVCRTQEQREREEGSSIRSKSNMCVLGGGAEVCVWGAESCLLALNGGEGNQSSFTCVGILTNFL